MRYAFIRRQVLFLVFVLKISFHRGEEAMDHLDVSGNGLEIDELVSSFLMANNLHQNTGEKIKANAIALSVSPFGDGLSHAEMVALGGVKVRVDRFLTRRAAKAADAAKDFPIVAAKMLEAQTQVYLIQATEWLCHTSGHDDSCLSIEILGEKFSRLFPAG